MSMDFSTFIIILIVLAILSVVGSVLWWVAIIWLGVTAWRRIAKRLDAEAIDLNKLIQQAAMASGPQRTGLEGQVSLKMLDFQRQMRDLDNLHRQRYELKAAEMQSYAASNGIFIEPPKW
jgi:hypothetical protein